VSTELENFMLYGTESEMFNIQKNLNKAVEDDEAKNLDKLRSKSKEEVL
jgi:hypothetical protein